MTSQMLPPKFRERGIELLDACESLSQFPDVFLVSALLSDFTPQEADLLGENMLRVRAQAGQVLIEEGEISNWMMLLLRGTVDISKRKIGSGSDADEPNSTTRLAVLKAGAVIGEMSMLDGEPRYASCSALSQVEAAVLTRDQVGHLIQAHPGVGAKLLVKLTQVLAQRLRNTSNQLIKVLRQRGA